PVVVVAVKNDRVVRRNAGAADEFFKSFLADDVAADLVLQLRLPVEPGRTWNMSRVVSLGVPVNLDEFDAGFAQVGFDPIGFHQHFRMCVTCHTVSFLFLSLLRLLLNRSSSPFTPSCQPTSRVCVSSCSRCT